jgi:hypothetical protein
LKGSPDQESRASPSRLQRIVTPPQSPNGASATMHLLQSIYPRNLGPSQQQQPQFRRHLLQSIRVNSHTHTHAHEDTHTHTHMHTHTHTHTYTHAHTHTHTQPNSPWEGSRRAPPNFWDSGHRHSPKQGPQEPQQWNSRRERDRIPEHGDDNDRPEAPARGKSAKPSTSKNGLHGDQAAGEPRQQHTRSSSRRRVRKVERPSPLVCCPIISCP